MKHDRHVVGLLRDEGIGVEWHLGSRKSVCTILQVDWSFEICLGDVVVVEESVGCGRNGEEDKRGEEEEEGGEVCFDGCRCDQQLEWVECCRLYLLAGTWL